MGNGALVETTRKYKDMIIAYGLKEWGPKGFNFEEFLKGLSSMQSTPVCQGCLRGGGRDNCEIRARASAKRIGDCSECGKPETCGNSELLQHMRTGARLAGLMVKTENVDRQGLIDKWTAELVNSWPYCVLFLAD